MDNSTLSINIGGKLMDFKRPRIMGILNVTPDSFYSSSRATDSREVQRIVTSMKDAGVDIIDIGGCSTRPGSTPADADEEMRRLSMGMEAIRKAWPEAVISVDTFRADVARRCVAHYGADIINDIGGGSLDKNMWATVAELKVPYVLMHTRGTPSTMQTLTDYMDVTADVLLELVKKADTLHQMGVADVILDPGFGFAKTVEQNFQMLGEIKEFVNTGMPVLAGISRKGMIWKTLGITPSEALNGTTVLNTIALLGGANLLRVHDVRAAAEAITLVEAMHTSLPGNTPNPLTL